MPKKRNGAGQDQEYVPAGNGDASGEYADEGGQNRHSTLTNPNKKVIEKNTKIQNPEKKEPKVSIQTDANNVIKRKQITRLKTKAERIQSIMNDTGMDAQQAARSNEELENYFGNQYYEYTDAENHQGIAIIDETLKKMPKYDGEIYRGMNFGYWEEQSRKYKNAKLGGTITFDNISSWSSERAVADEFAKLHQTETDSVIFIVKNNNRGAGVQHLSDHGEDEAEVLIPSKQKYKVVDKQIRNKYDMLKEELNQEENKSFFEFLEKEKQHYKSLKHVVLVLEEA